MDGSEARRKRRRATDATVLLIAEDSTGVVQINASRTGFVRRSKEFENQVEGLSGFNSIRAIRYRWATLSCPPQPCNPIMCIGKGHGRIRKTPATSLKLCKIQSTFASFNVPVPVGTHLDLDSEGSSRT